MQNAARAYGAIAKQIANPRELEADLLLKAASRLQAVQESWQGSHTDLSDALLYNRRLWSIFLTSVTDEASQLPSEIRQNVANLGLFVMKQTLSIMSDPKPERLSFLIKINREIAAGLTARA
jgi:flagellar biosynthesis activator protein FlaF